MAAKKRLVILASGQGSNLQAIIQACETGVLQAQIVAVITDRESAYALERARLHGIPGKCLAWRDFRVSGASREEYDTALAALVQTYSPDLIVLAGWMRLLTMQYLKVFSGKVINLHPALPGTYPGTGAIERCWQDIQTGIVRGGGVMVHFVPDEGVDNGPLIVSEAIDGIVGESLDDYMARVHAVEHRLIVTGIQSTLAAQVENSHSLRG